MKGSLEFALTNWLEAKSEHPVQRSQNRFCWLLNVLNEKFGNRFKLRAKRAYFGGIILPAFARRAGIFLIAIKTDFISYHSVCSIVSWPAAGLGLDRAGFRLLRLRKVGKRRFDKLNEL
jgi:hypothetical protein